MKKYDLDEEIIKLESNKDIFPIVPPKPTDKLIDEYQIITGIKIRDDYRNLIKKIGLVSCNGLENLSMFGDKNEYHDILYHMDYIREIGVPKDFLPISESNGDYYCLAPDGKVWFFSHNGTTDEHWENLAAWIHEVWIEGN